VRVAGVVAQGLCEVVVAGRAAVRFRPGSGKRMGKMTPLNIDIYADGADASTGKGK
jgi:hypothetical protein